MSVLILLLVCAVLPKTANGQSSQDQVLEHFRAGQEALRQGQFTQATEEFRRVLSLDPKLVEAQVNLGLAYHSLSEYEQAVLYLTKALAVRPNLFAANVIVGTDYLKLGSPAKSVSYLQRALKLDPKNLEAHQALAACYLRQENFRGAAHEFRQVAGLDPDQSEAFFRLGHQFLDLSARLAYRGARLYPDSAWGHRFLGDLLFERGRWDESAKEYQKALAIEPQERGLHASLGEAFLHGGHLDQAEEEFHSEVRVNPYYELAWVGLAELEVKKGQALAALESVNKAWEASPEVLALQIHFPTVEVTRDAAERLAIGLEGSPETPSKHFLVAALYSAAGESASAAQWKAFEHDLFSWQQSYRDKSSQSDCRLRRYSACVHWLEGQKLLSGWQQLQLGRMQFALGNYDAASDILASVRSTTNDNAEASYWLSRTYQKLGAESYARLEELFPNSWRAHQLRAEGGALRKDYKEATKEFQEALQINPDSPELHEALGELYLEMHSDDDARSELERALALDGSRAHALCLLGRLYVERHDNDRAVSYLQKTVRLQPDLVEASGLLGTAYVRMGRFAEAIPKLQNAAPFDHYGNVHYQLYVAYKKLGQAALAQKALMQSQELRRSSLEHDQAVIMGAPQLGSE